MATNDQLTARRAKVDARVAAVQANPDRSAQAKSRVAAIGQRIDSRIDSRLAGNTGPGATPGGPTESGPNGFQFPNIQELIDNALSRLPADQQAIARQRIGNIGQMLQDHLGQIGSHITAAQQGALPFHPSLAHIHGPDGTMHPPIGVGGLGGLLDGIGRIQPVEGGTPTPATGGTQPGGNQLAAILGGLRPKPAP